MFKQAKEIESSAFMRLALTPLYAVKVIGWMRSGESHYTYTTNVEHMDPFEGLNDRSCSIKVIRGNDDLEGRWGSLDTLIDDLGQEQNVEPFFKLCLLEFIENCRNDADIMALPDIETNLGRLELLLNEQRLRMR